MNRPVSLYLKRAGVFISRSLKVVASLISLWGITWLTCLQKCGSMEDAWIMFDKMPSGKYMWFPCNAVLGGCDRHEYSEEAFNILDNCVTKV
jgi:hypothetical protein